MGTLPHEFTLNRARAQAVFGLLLALFLLLITRNVSPEPYVYDEADYMYAASLGFAANWSDTPSIPMRDFVRAGLGHGPNGRPDTQMTLSEGIRSGNDVLFYRHFHGRGAIVGIKDPAKVPWQQRQQALAVVADAKAALPAILPDGRAALLDMVADAVVERYR